MVRRHLALLFIAALTGVAAAQEAPGYKFIPPPPGTIVQNTKFYLDGQSMHGAWRAVVSRKAAGRDVEENETFYQWGLTIYRLDDNGNYVRAYQAPAKGTALLDKLEKASGSSMWFPLQSAEIVGAASLMHDETQQLVVAVHQTGADCGSASITVFRFNRAAQKVVPAVSLANGCQLDAKVVHEPGGDVLALHGPYYAPSAPMCCPTKINASATLRYRNGKWVLSPNYYEVSVGKYAFGQ